MGKLAFIGALGKFCVCSAGEELQEAVFAVVVQFPAHKQLRVVQALQIIATTRAKSQHHCSISYKRNRIRILQSRWCCISRILCKPPRTLARYTMKPFSLSVRMSVSKFRVIINIIILLSVVGTSSGLMALLAVY